MQSARSGQSPQKSSRGRPVLIALRARRHPFVSQVAHGLVECGVTLIDHAAGNRATAREPLVIGLSGGADSVALLLSCVAIHQRKSQGLPAMPVAVHVNHHLRDSADDDERWVKNLCDCFGVPLIVQHVHPGALNGNIAANARELRYRALAQAAGSVGASCIAVAHHADDQLETAIMALCRGGSLLRLGGMAESRPIDRGGTRDDVRLIRPLLGLRKSECEAWCRTAGTDWREDPGNADTAHARARLRRDVIPILEELWPGAVPGMKLHAATLHAAQSMMKAEIARIESQAVGPGRWNRADLQRQPAAVLVAVFHDYTAGRLDGRTLWDAARAVRSADRDRRSFRGAARARVEVTAGRVSVRAPESAAVKGRGSNR